MKLILLELNEINFDAVQFYLSKGKKLPGFSKLFDKGIITTKAESSYDLLEPWIQWPSVHTGMTYDEHNIFRLGDFINSNCEQLFEKIEKTGFSVGAISPMNASNKLKSPSYFIPDPWTQTSSDKSFFSKNISDAISQAVNDNSQSKISLKTFLNLSLAFIFLVRPSKYIKLINYAVSSIGKPWRKAIFLDLFLHEIHKSFLRKKSPNFSTLFLNAGAHIQHHYFFNSLYVKNKNLKNPTWYISNNEDPFLDMLIAYDRIILDYLEMKDTEIIIATGLSQKPYEFLKFYYRLKDHQAFLKKVGVRYRNVIPRMTRDFLISFDTSNDAKDAEHILSQLLVNNQTKLFEELDNRGKEIFAVLTYPSEINDQTFVNINGNEIPLIQFVTFVAIKNGEHQSKGFAYFSSGLSEFEPKDGSHVSNIHDTVINYFNKDNKIQNKNY